MSAATPITVAHGDGIGPEIMAATLQILEAADAIRHRAWAPRILAALDDADDDVRRAAAAAVKTLGLVRVADATPRLALLPPGDALESSPFVRVNMAVGLKHIKSAIEVVVEEEQAKTGHRQGWLAQPQFAGGIHEIPLAASRKEAGAHLGEVRDGDDGGVLSTGLADIDPHAGDLPSEIIVGQAPFAADVTEGSIALIEEEELGREVVGDDQIKPTVAIEVGGSNAECLGGGTPRCVSTDFDASLIGDIRKRPVPAILVQSTINAGQRDWRQVVFLAVAPRPSTFLEGDLCLQRGRPQAVIGNK